MFINCVYKHAHGGATSWPCFMSGALSATIMPIVYVVQ